MFERLSIGVLSESQHPVPADLFTERRVLTLSDLLTGQKFNITVRNIGKLPALFDAECRVHESD